MKCKTCNALLPSTRNKNSKYCLDCAIVNRREVQKQTRLKHKARMESDDVTYICNNIYNKYKRRAAKKGILFKLTLNHFKMWYKVKCTYCGDIMSNVGIDRINSAEGYVMGNIQPCCPTCNMMKYTHKHIDFLKHVNKVVKNCS